MQKLSTKDGKNNAQHIKKMPRLGRLHATLIRNKNQAEQIIIIARKYGGVVCMSKFFKVYLVSSFSGIRRMTRDNAENYDKSFPRYQRLRQVLGAGLLVMSGKPWWHRRKLLQPFFTHKQIPRLTAISAEKTQELIERWKGFAKTKEPVNLVDEIPILVLQILAKLFFSCDIEHKEALRLAKIFSKAQHGLISVVTMLPWIPTVGQLRLRYQKAQLDSFIKKLIQQRKLDPNPPQDCLQALMTSTDGYTGKPLTQGDIIHEVRTFLGTGHETTGVALNWSMILLSQHPAELKKLYAELDNNLPEGAGMEVDMDCLEKLPYNKKVLQESMRLYPPTWTIGRRAVEQDELDGYNIPKNATILISAYVIHRLEEHWPDPERYDPERFSPEAIKARDKLAYIPFGMGAHTCIANAFALIQGQVSQAMLVKAFEMEFLSNDFSTELLFTIKPKYPVYVRLKERLKKAPKENTENTGNTDSEERKSDEK